MKNKIGKGIIEYLLNVMVREDAPQVEVSDEMTQQDAILRWKDPAVTEETRRALAQTLRKIEKEEKNSDGKESQTSKRKKLEGRSSEMKSIMTTKEVGKNEQVRKSRGVPEQARKNKYDERNRE